MIDNEKTLADIINENPAILGLKGCAVARLLRTKPKERKDGLSNRMTLQEFHDAWYLPNVAIVRQNTDDTRYQREVALRYWAEFTGNPKLKDIDVTTMTRFMTGMRAKTKKNGEPYFAPATIRKHCRALMSVLDVAGPRTPKNRTAVHLIPTPPPFPPVSVHCDVTYKTPTFAEFRQILAACQCAVAPQVPDCTPGQWWRSLYLVLYNTGIRREDILSARWRDVQIRDGRTVLVISARTEKTHAEKVMPLTPAAMSALEAMPCKAVDDLIFPWPASDSLLQKTRVKLAKAAGLPKEKVTFHAVRRLVGTTVDDAQLVLGHTTAATTRNHYQTIDRKAVALANLPQP